MPDDDMVQELIRWALRWVSRSAAPPAAGSTDL